MWPHSARPRAILRACAAVGFGLLGGWALDPELTLGAARGDWEAVSEGLRPTLDGTSRGSNSRALVHVHGLGPEPAHLVLVVSGRPRRSPPVLAVARDGQSLPAFPLASETRTLTVAVPANRDGVDVVLSLEAPTGAQPVAFDVHAIRIERRVGPARQMLRVLPLVAALAVYAWLVTRTTALEAVAWAAVASYAAAAGAIVAFDPTLCFRFAPDSRLFFRLTVLALVWALALRTDAPRWRGPLAAALTVGILYLPALNFGFVTDDFLFGRPLSAGELLSTLWDQWDPKGRANAHYRPVLAWSFALDYALWGARTNGWHLTNVIVQAAGAVLAGVFLRRLGLARRAALAGALAWAAHPLGACAASWSNERTDGLLSVFFLATLITLLAPRFSRATLAATCGYGLLALGSKEGAVVLPVCAALVLALKAATGGEPQPAADLGETSRRRAAVGLLALLAVLHASYWIRLFPTKAASGAGLSQRLTDLGGRGGLDAVASFLVPVFLPKSYGDWSGTTIDQQPLAYLLLGSVIGPLGLLWLWRCGAPRRLFGIAALGLVWPLVNVAPLLPLHGGLDLYRLGLLLALGFGLWFGAVFAALQATRPRLAVALTLALGCGFGPLAIDASQAWGRDGFAYRAGLSWKRADPGWRETIGEEMWRLSETEIEAAEHVRRLPPP